MRQIIGAISGIVFLSLISLAHASEGRVTIELISSSKISAGATVVSFKLLDSKNAKYLTPADLAISHEKVLHFIAYDPGLKEFQHVHPEFDGQVWNVNMNFAVNGNYFAWAQGEISKGSLDFNSMTRLEVSGGGSEWPSPSLDDTRSGTLSGSVATLSGDTLKAGEMAMLTLTFTKETDSSPADITPYLGAFAHVIATPEDGSSLLHVHPMDGDASNEGILHVTFPAEGFYRLWVQFIDTGVLKTIPLSVAVTK